jgi:hypothetical protein
MLGHDLHLLDHDVPIRRIEQADDLARAGLRIVTQLRQDLMRGAFDCLHPPDRQRFAAGPKLDRQPRRDLRARPA